MIDLFDRSQQADITEGSEYLVDIADVVTIDCPLCV